MAKVVPLSADEAAQTGFTHVINWKVPTDSGVVQANTVFATPTGTVCRGGGFFCRTAFNVITSPTLAVSVGGTTVVSATALTANSTVVSNTISSAAGNVVLTVGGTGGPATAGEVNVFLNLVDMTKSLDSFAK